ncbi:hypothetical protein B566_EDAN001552 [Ephemera danica]|nr:hypothetical protein B566_EDAN001552 [Ephemera danica]
MPQGKLKVKAKLPAGVKTKKKSPTKRGAANTKRQNRPAPPKSAKMLEAQRLKRTMSKNINMIMEEELRQKALEGRTALAGRKRSAPAASEPATSSAPAQEEGPKRKKRKN